jgi:hypothetical protein
VNYRLFPLKDFGSVLKPSRQTILLVIAVPMMSAILGYAISSGGVWSRLLFFALGVSVLLAVPVNWLVFGAIALYQGFPLNMLDIALLTGSDINFRLSDLLLLLILARSIAAWFSASSQTTKNAQPNLRILAILVTFLLWAFCTSLIFGVEGHIYLLEYMTSLGKVVLALSLAFYTVFPAKMPDQVEMVLKWVVWWGIIQCLAGLVRWLPLILTGMDWVPAQLLTSDTLFWLAIPSHPVAGGLATMTGLFSDPAKLGYWLLVSLWAKIYFVRRKGGKATARDLVQSGLLLLGLIATSRRGTLIALVISVLAYLVATRQDMPSLRSVFRFPSLVVVAGALVLVAGAIIDPLRPLSDAFRITDDINYGLRGRLEQSLALWSDFLGNPIFGVGWMGTSLAGKTFWAVSNYPLILADLGLIGFSLLLMLVASTLYRCWRNIKCHPKGSGIGEMYLFVFVSLISIYAAMISDIILIGGQPALLLLGICLGIAAKPAAWRERKARTG